MIKAGFFWRLRPLFVGDAAQAASLESTSATTTYHRMTVDGVGVFYREAGPKDAPTIVLLHGFPSSSREFDTLIPLLATRYHLIAPDFPGFGQSDAPPPSSSMRTPLTTWPKTTNDLLEQLKIDKCSFYLHDYGGPVGFRIILAHPERVQALIIQNANAYKEGLGAKWAGSRSIGPIQKRILKCSMPLYRERRPNSVIRSAPRIPTATTPIPGLTNTPTCRNPGNTRSRPLCSTTTGRTSPHIRRGKRGCASTSRRLWWSGDETTPRSSLPGERLSSAICQMPKSICSTLAISLWMRRTTRLRGSFSRFWPGTRLTGQYATPGCLR